MTFSNDVVSYYLSLALNLVALQISISLLIIIIALMFEVDGRERC